MERETCFDTHILLFKYSKVDDGRIVDERQGREASDKCRQLQMDVEYRSFPGLGHDVWPSNLNPIT